MATATQTPQTGRRGSVLLVVLSVVLGLLLILFGIYAGISVRYGGMFLPNSTINGIDVSGMTVAQVEQTLMDNQSSYTLTLLERDGVTETITGEEIGLTLSFDGTLDELLAEQNNWTWPLTMLLSWSNDMTVDTMYSYDTALLTEAISNLACMNSSTQTSPRDAYLSGYSAETGGVEIVPEVEGNLVDQEILLPAIQNAVATMQTELDLEELGCYVEPAVTSDDPTLLAQAEAMNQYLNVEITYEFGSETEVLDGSTIINWLETDEDGNLTVSEDEVTAYVRSLAYNHNTYGATRTIMSSYGQEVTVEGGDYGWWMDEPATVDDLYDAIINQESGVREPIWQREAVSFDDPDYGDSYIELNLTAQQLFYIQDGEIVLTSDVVTGLDSVEDRRTPTGTYGLTYKQSPGTLVGEGYNSDVRYWMPFYYNVGLHDADWRSSFGGTIYKTNGSHGCVNMPIANAAALYDLVDTNTPIFVYELEGTERSETSGQIYED